MELLLLRRFSSHHRAEPFQYELLLLCCCPCFGFFNPPVSSPFLFFLSFFVLVSPHLSLQHLVSNARGKPSCLELLPLAAPYIHRKRKNFPRVENRGWKGKIGRGRLVSLQREKHMEFDRVNLSTGCSGFPSELSMLAFVRARATEINFLLESLFQKKSAQSPSQVKSVVKISPCRVCLPIIFKTIPAIGFRRGSNKQ